MGNPDAWMHEEGGKTLGCNEEWYNRFRIG